jgi:hypothetical protein
VTDPSTATRTRPTPFVPQALSSLVEFRVDLRGVVTENDACRGHLVHNGQNGVRQHGVTTQGEPVDPAALRDTRCPVSPLVGGRADGTPARVLADGPQQLLDLVPGQRGRWLVHDQDAGVERKGLRDGGELPLTGTKPFDETIRTQDDAGPRQQAPCLAEHPAAIQLAESGHRLPA